jgi:SOS-response transcriptional repressor LexA
VNSAEVRVAPCRTNPRLGFRGLQVLRFVEARLSAGKRAPSYAEIARHLGFGSVSDVGKVVRRLEKRGLKLLGRIQKTLMLRLRRDRWF